MPDENPENVKPFPESIAELTPFNARFEELRKSIAVGDGGVEAHLVNEAGAAIRKAAIGTGTNQEIVLAAMDAIKALS